MLTGIRNRARTVRTVVTAAMLAGAAGAGAQIKYSLVAELGGAAPSAGGATFGTLAWGSGNPVPYINDAGMVVVRTTLAGAGVTSSNDAAIYGGSAGAMLVLAREGSAAPGTEPGVVFDGALSFAAQLGGGAGPIAFSSWLAGPGVVAGMNDNGLWAGTTGAVELAARIGSWAPGTGSIFSSFGVPAINGFGQLAFSASLNEVVFNNGLWFGAIGHMTCIAREGDHAPGLDPGVIYGSFMTSSTAPSILINSSGQVLYRATVAGTGIGGANNTAMWAGTPTSPDSMLIVARRGNAAAGAGGATWLGYEEPVLTDAGAVAFRGIVSGANPNGIWRGYILGVLDLVAREGDGAPGTYTGTYFSSLSGVGSFGVPKMNNANQVAFRAQLAGFGVTSTNDTGIWADNDIGALVLVAREGDAALGAGGAVFTGFDTQSPVLNGLGQVAFLATLSSGIHGMWATDPYGVMHLVTLEYTPVTLAPGVTRTVISLMPIAGRGVQDGTSTTFNDQGVLFIRASTTAGTDLFLADVNDQCRPVFTEQPAVQTVAPGGTATFTVTTTGPGVHGHQWRRDGVNLVNGSYVGSGTIIGADTATLEVFGAEASDSGVYDCVVTNKCGSVTSDGAQLTVGCPSDYNGDGFVDPLDYNGYINDFEAGSMSADYNKDGFLDPLDYNGFINDFEAGC